MNIFDKPYFALGYFSYEVFVSCPNCQGKGIITTAKEGYFYEKSKSAKFNCLDCGHAFSNDKEWFGYYIGYIGFDYKGRACGHCGSVFQKVFGKTQAPYKVGLAKCPVCKQAKEYEIKWYRYKGETPTDPFFGLDLFFQKEVKNGILWIYNLEHLDYLREYVNSTIRKREAVRQVSMVAKLPAFIISSKNKASITKQLDFFEKQIRRRFINKA